MAANNGLQVTKADIWQEICHYYEDLRFFRVDALVAASKSPDPFVRVKSEADCSSDRIAVLLNTWALARSSSLSAPDLKKLLASQHSHYTASILHPTSDAPVDPGIENFIDAAAERERHFQYGRPILLCNDLAAEDDREGAITNGTSVGDPTNNAAGFLNWVGGGGGLSKQNNPTENVVDRQTGDAFVVEYRCRCKDDAM